MDALFSTEQGIVHYTMAHPQLSMAMADWRLHVQMTALLAFRVGNPDLRGLSEPLHEFIYKGAHYHTHRSLRLVN
jgi:hypothetical protein